MGAYLPDRLQISGRWYVAEDALARPEPDDGDPWLPIKALCKENAVDVHRAYDAAREGRLDARLPQGATRGMRCRRSEFRRWMEEDLLRRCA